MIDASEIKAAAAALRAFDDVAGPELEAAEHRAGDAIADRIRAQASRHVRTGRMVKRITVKATGHGAATQVRIHAGGPVAHLIAGGVAPHTIRPVRSHALAIHRGGSIVGFAEAVQHRGIRADPFFADGVDDAQAELDSITAKAADGIAGELATRVRRR